METELKRFTEIMREMNMFELKIQTVSETHGCKTHVYIKPNLVFTFDSQEKYIKLGNNKRR